VGGSEGLEKMWDDAIRELSGRSDALVKDSYLLRFLDKNCLAATMDTLQSPARVAKTSR
jgi:hypothetical protein